MNDFTRSLIREGDTTTSGGVVLGGLTRNVFMHGKLATFAGDPVECPACRSIGFTECVQPYRVHTGPDGRQHCLDGDLCRCRCLPPPRLKALNHQYAQGFSRAHFLETPGGEGWLAYAGHGSALAPFDECFVVHDEATGLPFAEYAYGLKTRRGYQEAALGELGTTHRVYADDDDESVELTYLVQTSMGMGR